MNDLLSDFISKNGTMALISKPTLLADLSIPKIGGLEKMDLSIGLDLLQLGLRDFSDFTLLKVPSGMSLQDLHNRIATERFTLSARMQLDTREPKSEEQILGRLLEAPLVPGQRNNVTLSLHFDSLEAVLDMLLKLLQYDVESLRIGELLHLDCLVSKLQPFGGVQNLTLALQGLGFGIVCHECQSSIVQELSDKMSTPGASDQLADFITGFLSGLADSVQSSFTAENWNATMTAAKSRCEK
jgi:hypothetical protein